MPKPTKHSHIHKKRVTVHVPRISLFRFVSLRFKRQSNFVTVSLSLFLFACLFLALTHSLVRRVSWDKATMRSASIAYWFSKLLHHVIPFALSLFFLCFESVANSFFWALFLNSFPFAYTASRLQSLHYILHANLFRWISQRDYDLLKNPCWHTHNHTHTHTRTVLHFPVILKHLIHTHYLSSCLSFTVKLDNFIPHRLIFFVHISNWTHKRHWKTLDQIRKLSAFANAWRIVRAKPVRNCVRSLSGGILNYLRQSISKRNQQIML